MQPEPLHPSRNSQRGYGLIVVAALFTAFALIAATAIDRNAIEVDLGQQQAAKAQLTRLTIALAKYARYNSNRFPCPASLQLLVTDSNFGAPAAATCYTGTATPAGTSLLTTTPANKLIAGMVPVKALVPYGVSYSDAFDPWGSRITYVVHRDLTSGVVAIPAITDPERPQVTDYITSETITPYPDMILISYGRDRIGGRLRSQSVLTNAAITCGTGQRRYANCDGDNLFTIGPINSATSVAADSFDDFISAYRYGAT